MGTLAIALAYTGKDNMRIPPIVAGLCVMKILAPTLYLKAQSGTLTYDDAYNFFDFGMEQRAENWPSEFFIKWWRYALDSGLDDKSIAEFNNALFNFSLRNRFRVVPVTANQIIDRFIRGK